MNKILLILVLGFLSEKAIAESIKIKKNGILGFLYDYKSEIDDINNNFIFRKETLVLPIKISKRTYDRQIIVKNETGLFIILEGTGIVYKAISSNKDSILFSRIDSTIFFGNSFNSINFSNKDTLFSLGGYGFWKNNGQLRYFKNNEWFILPISQEIPVTNHIYFLNRKKSIIYLFGLPFPNQAEKNSKDEEMKPLVFFLDIKNRENKIVGRIKDNFKSLFTNGSRLWNSTEMNGTILRYNQNVYLVDFENNKIYNSIQSKIFDQICASVHDQSNYIFQIKNTVYFVKNSKNDSIYSISIKRSDFEYFGTEFYSTHELDNKQKKIFVLIALTILTLFGIFILLNILKRIKKYKIFSNIQNNRNLSINEDSNFLMFSDFEKTVINRIIKENIISVEALNHILGLGKKSIEIQKKSRNDVIHRINHKFKVIFNSEAEFIERIRSEEDRRYFKYTINEANQQLFKDHQKKHS